MSNVQIKALETDNVVVNEVASFDERVYNTVQKLLQENASKIVADAVAKGIQSGADLSNALVDDVKKQLIAISKGQTQVLAVQINEGDVKKLSSEAVPYLPRLIINAKSNVNTMLVGPAGSGKSFSAKQLAEALGLPFGFLNLTAGASETWLYGRQTPNGFIEGTFSKMYREGGVFLLDEIDAADANLLLCINTAIAGDELYNPISGEHFKKHPNFVVIAAANTYGKGGDSKYTGRARLDASTLDRFVQIKVDYNTDIEEKLCTNEALRNVLWKMREKLVDIGSQEFISTRAMQIAQRQFDGGVSANDILDSLTLSWPEDMREEIKETVRKFREEGGVIEKKKRGRPAGSKNKKDDDEIPF